MKSCRGWFWSAGRPRKINNTDTVFAHNAFRSLFMHCRWLLLPAYNGLVLISATKISFTVKHKDFLYNQEARRFRLRISRFNTHSNMNIMFIWKKDRTGVQWMKSSEQTAYKAQRHETQHCTARTAACPITACHDDAAAVCSVYCMKHYNITHHMKLPLYMLYTFRLFKVDVNAAQKHRRPSSAALQHHILHNPNWQTYCNTTKKTHIP